MGQCSVSGCTNSIYCKQVCHTHYKRMRRTGKFARTIREDGAGTFRGGYIYVMIDGVRKNQHIFMAEAALGKRLPVGAEVHHVDGNRLNNDPTNLVVCPDLDYHRLLHKRQRALDVCGNANWEICRVCRKYDDVQNLKGSGPDGRKYHKGDMRVICNSNRCRNG